MNYTVKAVSDVALNKFSIAVCTIISCFVTRILCKENSTATKLCHVALGVR